MEACMMKPEVKNKPKPPKPPPKPTQLKTHVPEKPEKPIPVVPLRPTDAELSHTQYRLRRSATSNNESNGSLKHQDTREKPPETAVVPARPTPKELKATTRYNEHRKSSRETDQSEAAVDEVDFKQSSPSVLYGMFRQSQKEKTPSFTSFVTDVSDAQEKTDVVSIKQAPSNKPGALKGVMKGLQFKLSPKTSREPSPDPRAEETEGTSSEKEQPAEKKKLQNNVETRQDKGGLLAGMFRKTPKERSSSPSMRVSEADSDAEDAEEEEKSSEETNEKGGFFSSIIKKSNKAGDETSAQENLSDHSELSVSSDSLSEHKEKGGIFSGMFRKPPKPAEAAKTDLDQQSLPGDLSGSNDNLTENRSKEKGFFSGLLRKSPKIPGESKVEQGAESLHGDLSTSSDSLSENKEKGGFFGLLRKTPKAVAEENLSAHSDVSGSSESLSEASSTKEKGGPFSGKFKKSSRLAESSATEEEKKSPDSEPSSSSEGPAESLPKEKGGIFGAIFKKPPKSAEAAQSEEHETSDTEANNENLSENKQEKGGGFFGGLLKKTPKGEKAEMQDKEAQRALSASSEELSGNKEKNIFSNMFRKTQKPAEGATAETEVKTDSQLSASSENLTDTTGPKEKKGGLAGIFKRSSSLDNLFDEDKNIFSSMFKKTPKPTDEESNASEGRNLFGSSENLLETNTGKEKTGGFVGIFKKSPKPAPRSVATQDPLSSSQQLSASCDSLTDIEKEDEMSASNDDLSDTTSTTKEKRVGFSGMFRRAPKNTEQQEGEESQPLTGAGLKRKKTIKKKKRVVSFRIKKTLPQTPKQSSDKMPIIEEAVELQDLSTPQENTVVVQPVEMAAYPTEENAVETQQENNELMEWWNTVKGWAEWNESSNFQEEDEQMAMEQAADRVYMAARVFVYLFNQKGASLQHRILELLALADAADEFHKKTVTAAVGGGVASVAGSVATITGLILAPFTFGASIIVTAVGIGVATAGSITSATANITDTVHSNMDRKKVEKMIQGYQEEIKDIRKCMEFVQEGMDTLQDWDFDKYSESAAKKALNHNIKHVMKEGGRAGKALMINTDKLISTVQVLGAAGGAAKAAQAISVTTGVMSALFLALDVFFLAKDSHELRKGAKTKFAGKIRQVCKELQEGLLELNKVKTQLQKTMDGIEVEEYEEIEEVEVEVEDDLESDPKKLAELELEIDILEKKLDKKEDNEQNKSKETEKDIFKIRKKEKAEKSQKDKGGLEEKEEKKVETNAKTEGKEESMLKSKSETIPDEKRKINETSEKTAKEEVLREQSQKGNKRDKETENQLTAGKEKKHESKHEKTKEDTNRATERKKNKTEKELEETKSRSGDSEKDSSLKPRGEEDKTERRHERRSSREDEGGRKAGRKTENETESSSTRRPSSSWSVRDGDKHERKEGRGNHHKNGENDRMESWRGREEEKRGVKDWKAEMAKSRVDKREDHGHTDGKKESHRGHREETTRGREREALKENSREETRTGHCRRGNEEFRETRGDEKRGSRVESARSLFERPAGEEEEEEERRQKRKEREIQRGGNREHEHTRRGSRGSRSRSDALRENGLCI